MHRSLDVMLILANYGANIYYKPPAFSYLPIASLSHLEHNNPFSDEYKNKLQNRILLKLTKKS